MIADLFERRERRQPRQASFELANIGRNVLRDVQRDLGRQPQVFERRLLLHDRDAGLEVGRRDIRDQSRSRSDCAAAPRVPECRAAPCPRSARSDGARRAAS